MFWILSLFCFVLLCVGEIGVVRLTCTVCTQSLQISHNSEQNCYNAGLHGSRTSSNSIIVCVIMYNYSWLTVCVSQVCQRRICVSSSSMLRFLQRTVTSSLIWPIWGFPSFQRSADLHELFCIHMNSQNRQTPWVQPKGHSAQKKIK